MGKSSAYFRKIALPKSISQRRYGCLRGRKNLKYDLLVAPGEILLR